MLLRVISYTLSLVQRNSALGPNVVMMVQMLRDMTRFLILMAGPLLGFAAAFKVILSKSLGTPCVTEGLRPDTNEQAGYWAWLVALIQVMLGADDMLQCLHDHHHTTYAWVLMNIFLTFMMLLSLNMLIAMMNQTYQQIHVESRQIFMHLCALSTVTWLESGSVPPPLTLLSLPYYLLRPLIQFVDPEKTLRERCTSCLYSRLVDTDDHLDDDEQALFEKSVRHDGGHRVTQSELREAIQSLGSSAEDRAELADSRMVSMENRLATMGVTLDSISSRLPAEQLQKDPSKRTLTRGAATVPAHLAIPSLGRKRSSTSSSFGGLDALDETKAYAASELSV